MPPRAETAVGCTTRPIPNARTGFSDCPTCQFHGRRSLHLAYSIGRQHGMNPVRAQAFAAAHAAMVAEARADGTDRDTIAAQLNQLAAARAAQLARRPTPATRRTR